MSLKLETARIPIVLTSKEWAALCVRFVLGESLSEESAAIYELAKLKLMQHVYHAAKALGPEPGAPFFRVMHHPGGKRSKSFLNEVGMGNKG